MNRLMLLAAATTLLGVGKLTNEVLVDPPVNLQATTPGTQQTGNINVSGTVLAGTFYGSSGGTSTKVVSGWATSAMGFVFGGDFRTNSVDGRGIFASALATTGSNYGGDFRSASNAGRGIFGYATSLSGKGIGGDFRSDSSNGIGVIGRVTTTTGAAVGGQYTTASKLGIGVQAASTNTVGATYAGLFDSSSTDSTVSTGYFRANGSTGSVKALRAKVTTSDDPYVMAISADGRRGYGAYFLAQASGGWGLRAEGSSRGVEGYSAHGRGVAGDTDEGISYGVIGTAPLGSTGNAIYAQGTFAASGTKALKIDHPDDPENKYLLQYCAEGDTPQLNYTGIVKLDSNGAATVFLPNYFDKINRNPTYQLTALGASMPNLYVSELERNNQFRIAGGKAGASVSWTVVGIRNDRYMQQYGAKTEMDKPEENKGTYLMPELYNKPRQLREGYSPKEDYDPEHQQPVAQIQKNQAKSVSRTR